MVRSVLASGSYLRAVFVLVGAALALALGIAVFTVVSLVDRAGAPVWVTALTGVVLTGGPLLAGLVPAARQIEGVAAQGLLGVEFPDGPPDAAAGWPQRRRTLGWFLLHVFTGLLVVAAVLGLIALDGSWWTAPAAVATVLGTLLAGRFLAWLGPGLLGPSYAERLQRLEADAARATERNRIAREIHDSVGHALSVVTIQASAARKLIDRDPGFAAEALATIETASRRAAAELDDMLSLLRYETPDPAAPAHDLGSLGDLLTSARSAGLSLNSVVSGDLSRLPSLVSQEAYRIVQEGLTNALKYSADRTAGFDLTLGPDTLGIRLSSPAGTRRAARAGRGLLGIEERAAALGGTATAGPQDGRWVLSVTLPVREAAVTPIRVLLADDEPLVRSGLRAILESEPDITVVGEADDGAAVIAEARRTHPDIVLMDVRMPRVDGIAATRQLGRFEGGGPAVIVVTTFENDDYVYDALQAGARGFLLKRATADDFANAIRTVHNGESLLFPAAVRRLATRRGGPGGGLAEANLTDREAEVLRLIAQGRSNAEIAAELFLGVETVKTHVRNVLAKLGARDRVQAVITAYESGFIR